jgi:membrane protease subunit HflK
MNDHPHSHEDPPAPVPPDMPIDTGSQALSEALRSSFAIIRVVMVILVLVFIGSGFFTVKTQERAILLHFGKPVGEGEKALLAPGSLHWAFPYPIDEVVSVPVTDIQKITSTVGWFAVTPEQDLAGIEPPAGPSLNPAVDGYVITADENIIHTRATLTYKISDPIRYVFGFVNASNAVQNALDNAILTAATRFKVDDILTRDQLGFREAVRRRVAELVKEQDLGIQIDQCSVQSVPPRQLKEPFANVLKAELTRSKVLNEARSAENQTTNKASADAGTIVNLAQSDRARLVADVAAQADRFQQILPQFERQPELFAQQRLTETLGRVLTNVQYKIYVTEAANGKSKELRLLLNRELPKRQDLAPKQ